MSDLEEILVDGETVLWAGRPDMSIMKPLKPFWLRKLTHLLWLLFFASLVAAFFWGSSFYKTGTLNVIFIVFAVIILFGLVIGGLAFLDFKDRAIPYHHDQYAITNRRLLVRNSVTGSSHSVFPNSVCYLVNSARRVDPTLAVYVGHGEDDAILLFGLRDAEKVEKMIAEKFSIKEGKK